MSRTSSTGTPAATTRRPARTREGFSIRSSWSSVSVPRPREMSRSMTARSKAIPASRARERGSTDLRLGLLPGAHQRVVEPQGLGAAARGSGDELLGGAEGVALVEHLAHEGEPGEVVGAVVAGASVEAGRWQQPAAAVGAQVADRHARLGRELVHGELAVAAPGGAASHVARTLRLLDLPRLPPAPGPPWRGPRRGLRRRERLATIAVVVARSARQSGTHLVTLSSDRVGHPPRARVTD